MNALLAAKLLLCTLRVRGFSRAQPIGTRRTSIPRCTQAHEPAAAPIATTHVFAQSPAISAPAIAVPSVAKAQVRAAKKTKTVIDTRALCVYIFGTGVRLLRAVAKFQSWLGKTAIRSIERMSADPDEIAEVARHQVMTPEALVFVRGRSVLARLQTLDELSMHVVARAFHHYSPAQMQEKEIT